MINIENLKIFSWIDKEMILKIMMLSNEKEFQKWDIVFTKWEVSNWEWYIIKSWKLKISINWKEISILKDWDIVWEIALLNEDTRSADVEAIEDTKLIVININTIINLLNNDDNSINKEIIRRIEENMKY